VSGEEAGGVPSLGPLGPLAACLAAEQKLGRLKPGVDPERAAFAIFAIPFAAVMTARMSPESRRTPPNATA